MTEGSAVHSQHLEIDELAALLDGNLEGADRERAAEHLAVCPSCYELFADTARFLRDEEAGAAAVADEAGPAVPPGEPPPGRLLRPPKARWRGPFVATVLAAAAALAVVLLTPLGAGLFGGGGTLAAGQLMAALPPAAEVFPAVDAAWDNRGWAVMRGAGPVFGREQEQAFQLGVRVVETEVALAAGDAELAGTLTYRLEELLEPLELADPVIVLYAGDEGIRGRLEAGEDPAALLPLSRQADEILTPAEPDDDPAGFGRWYELGKWAAAAHLAAGAGHDEFFAGRAARRYLHRLEGEELPADVAPLVARLGEELRRRPPDWPAVEGALVELIAVAGGGRPRGA